MCTTTAEFESRPIPGAYPGGLWPPRSLKGHQKKKKKERERKGGEKEGKKGKKKEKINQHDEYGTIQTQAGAPGGAPGNKTSGTKLTSPPPAPSSYALVGEGTNEL